MLAVVPHSLNNLPDLLPISPQPALFLLAATSLLFGLPMAILQIKQTWKPRYPSTGSSISRGFCSGTDRGERWKGLAATAFLCAVGPMLPEYCIDHDAS
ncbi:MAG TPA: hypothetical protein VMW63_08870 [Methanoregulaceae archaeon]|nr:hypothetical protein [Methanoregulaceae archaeon]